MIVFRWNGSDLSQFTTITSHGTITVSGGKIVLAASAGNANKDTLGFYYGRFYLRAVNAGVRLLYRFEVSDLGAGDGFTPNQINQITNNSTWAGGSTPFPDWRSGLGLWLRYDSDPTHFKPIRDTTHNPNVTSTVELSVNTPVKCEHIITAPDGKHALYVNDVLLTDECGPTTSGGSYIDRRYTNNATQGGDFNNTTNPLTVVDAQLNYPNGYDFQQPGFHEGQIVIMTDAGDASTEEMLVTDVTGNDVTFQRGYNGTTIVATPNVRNIYAVQECYFYLQNQSGSITSRYSDITLTDGPDLEPPPPEDLAAATGSGDGEVDLTWSDADCTATNTDYISVRRSSSSGGSFSEVAQVDLGEEAYTDTAPIPGTTYYYKICAVVSVMDEDYESDLTDEESAASGGTAPDKKGGTVVRNLIALGKF